MGLLVPSIGERTIGQYFTNFVAPTDVKYHLYTNNHNPAAGDTVLSYTECTDVNYAAVTLTGANWVWATAGGVTTGTYAQQTFNFAAGNSIFGYYVTDNANVTLLWAEAFGGGPIVYGTLGGQLLLTPSITVV